jgi:DNA-binding NtrC family response regulator
MQILVVETDHLIRDQVKVGLQQFAAFSVTCGEGYAGINLIRQRDFDAVFLGVPEDPREARRMIEHLRGIRPKLDLIVLASERVARDLASDKQRLGIWSIHTTPIEVIDFFRLLSRVKERLGDGASVEAAPEAGSRRAQRSTAS